MRSTRVPSASVVDPDVSAVQGGAAYMTAIERRLAPSCERAEPRQRAMAYLRGLLSPAARQNSWQWAEVSGDATPYAFQHLWRRALGAPEAVREEWRHDVVPHVEAPEAVLVLDETGVLNQGRHSAGVARPYSGTAGRLENCHLGVFVGEASGLGHAVLDRELYRPKAWADEPARCRQAGLPEDPRVATKPPLAQRRLQRALAAGVPARWVTGDSVYGDDRRLRMGLEGQPHASVLAVSGTEHVWLDWRQRRVNTLLAGLPLDGWTRLSAGDGTTGARWDDWRWLPLAAPVHPAWRRWVLGRRSVSAPQELQASVVFAPQDTTLEAVVRGAGTRWVIEQLFEAAKGEGGLDHDEVRSWTGWNSPSHPRHVGVGPVDRLAGGGPCGGAAKKKPAASPGAQSSASVQSQPRPRLPLSVPEIRRLWWRLVLAVEQTAPHILAWSRWRRWHQQLATYDHDQQRGAWLGLWAA